MNSRHLLPDEIHLLLDNEEGFGMAPLRNHLRECQSCAAELRTLESVMTALEGLPHLEPPPLFADRVLEKVQVFEPWHVAVFDRIRSLVPNSPAGRLAFGTVVAALAVVTSVTGVWLAQRADALLFVAGLGLERVREGAWGMIQAGVASVAGDAAVASLQGGSSPVALGVAAVGLAAFAGVAYGVNAIATSGTRRRS